MGRARKRDRRESGPAALDGEETEAAAEVGEGTRKVAIGASAAKGGRRQGRWEWSSVLAFWD